MTSREGLLRRQALFCVIKIEYMDHLNPVIDRNSVLR